MPSISARAKWWCQCDFLFEDPKFRVYVQKWRMRVYNEGYYWHISFKCQKPCSFPLLPCTSISDLVPSINSLFLEVYSEIHLPPGFAIHSFVHPKSEKKSNSNQKRLFWGGCFRVNWLVSQKPPPKTCKMHVFIEVLKLRKEEKMYSYVGFLMWVGFFFRFWSYK